MTTIVTRAGKGSPLTNTEVDNNFSNLNAAKLELGQAQSSATANSLLWFNGSKLPTTGSVLTFDGSNLTATTSALYPNISMVSSGNNAIFGFKINNTGAGGVDWRVEQGRSAVGAFNISAPAVTGSPLYAILANATAQYWSTTSGEAMRLTSTGLGIGTSSPAAKLDVTANAAIMGYFRSSGGSANDKRVTVTSGGNRVVLDTSDNSTGAATALAFTTGGTEQMRLLSTGNLGIGTSSPSWKLDVQTAQSRFQVRDGANTGGTSAGTGLVSVNTTATALDSFNYRATVHAFIVDASEAMRLNSTGLGIGTSSPADKLDVVGNARVRDALVMQRSSSSLYLSVLNYGDSLGGAKTDNLSFGLVGGGNLLFWTNGTERMRLSDSGNVGIGTSSPGQKLTVAGTQRIQKEGAGYETAMLSFSTLTETGAIYRIGMASGGSLAIGRSDSNTTNLTLDASGNLGIGTTSPAAALHVASGNFRLTNGAAFTTADSLIREINTASGSANQYVTASIGFRTGNFSDAGVITFGTANNASTPTERMRLNQVGNLGIGTSSPTQKLDVNGNAKFTGGQIILDAASANYLYFKNGSKLVFSDTVGNERAVIDSSGNLGLGVTPSAWNSAYKAFDVSNWASLAGEFTTQGSVTLAVNAFANSTGYNNWTYRNNGGATRYKQNDGIHSWYTASFGIAGNSISFTQALTLDSNGNLALGTTSSDGMRIAVTGYSPELYDPSAYSAKFAYHPKGSQGSFGVSTGSTAKAGYGNLINISVNDNSGGDAVYLGAVAQSNGNSGANFVFGRRTGAQTWAESARIDSAGKFGLGTTAPYATLDVGSRGAQILTSVFTTGVDDLNFRIGAINGVAGSTGALQGQLGLFYLGSGESATIGFVRGGGANDGSVTFRTNGSERARVDSSGNLLLARTDATNVGSNTNTTAGMAFMAANYAHIARASSGSKLILQDITNRSGTYATFVSGSAITGSIDTNGTTTTYATSSDGRMKENIAPAGSAGSVIDAIEIVQFDWKVNGSHTPFGVIAQDLQATAPYAVKQGDAGTEVADPWGVDYSKLVPLLIKEVQALRARVAALESI